MIEKKHTTLYTITAIILWAPSKISSGSSAAILGVIVDTSEDIRENLCSMIPKWISDDLWEITYGSEKT